jgi:hypothetical protein
MIAFIDDHSDAHGVEPICKVLPIAPSTCRRGPGQDGQEDSRNSPHDPEGVRTYMQV